MNPLTETDKVPRASEPILALERRVDELVRLVAELTRIVMARADREEAGEDSVSRQIGRLARRLNDQERRAASVANRVDGQEETLRMICLLLKDLDDPYGMGTGLDERLGLIEGAAGWDDSGEPS